MVYGFKGKNGSGKTMLMRAISGLIFDYFDGDKVEGMHFTGKLPSYDRTFHFPATPC